MDTNYIFSDIVKIPPYIGENYQDGLWGKRVLILGNSFYCNKSTCIKYNSECWEKKECQENCEGFSDYCIDSINDSSSPFHKKITSMISGKDCFKLTEKEWNLEWENVWSKVAFYNFVTTVIV